MSLMQNTAVCPDPVWKLSREGARAGARRRAGEGSQFPTGVTLGRGDLEVGTFKGAQNCFTEGGSQ